MPRIVCQVFHRPNRLTFLWSEGPACFEPYHLEGTERDQFLQLAQLIQTRLAESADGAELAQRGHQLYRALFRQDAGIAGLNEIHSWFANLAQGNQIEKLEFLCDDSARFPWNALIDEIPSAESMHPGGDGWQRFFGARFNLGVGSRVNALRQFPLAANGTQLLAADLTLIEAITDAGRARLEPFHTASTLLQSVVALTDEVKTNPPDLLLLLVRFEQGQLWLGPDSFSMAELQGWLQEARNANPDPVVILMGSGSAGQQRAWQALLASTTGLFNALVANEVLLPAEQVFEIGTNLAQAFAQGKQSLGEALRSLRQTAGAGGLAFSAFCPPELRVAQEGVEDPVPDTVDMPLPDAPYRPFAAYEAADRPLFFGRQEETIACAAVVDQAGTCGVFLHGSPAVGKTSFLQAGLLPYLEQESVGYRVLRDRTPLDVPVAETDYPVLVLRCTSDLTGQFADALAVFCAQPLTYTTPLGQQVTVDLPNLLTRAVTGQGQASTAIQSEAIRTGITSETDTATEDAADEEEGGTVEGMSARELWIALRDRKDLLAQVIDEITHSLPFELVIAVDQGEELITLVRTQQQQERRQKALEMLMHLASVSPRCKLVFTVQSQNLGQLISMLPRAQTPAGWRVYLLPPLSDGKMIDALLWPTNHEQIPYTSEVPYQKYGFAFEEGMAPRVVSEANEVAAAEQQSPLPILQAVGALLYEEQVQQKKQNIVRMDDLKQFGGIKEVLLKCLERKLQRLPVMRVSQKALRILIGKLYTSHSDGTLSRNLMPASDLKTYWQRSPEPVEQVVNTAAEAEGLFEIQQLLIGGQHETYVSLPQDSLARLGSKMDEQTRQRTYARSRVIDVLWIMVPLVFCAAAVSFWATRNFLRGTTPEAESEETQKKLQQAEGLGTLRGRAQLRSPLYLGLVAQANEALRAGNALRARQLLLSEPAMRSFADDKSEKIPVPDLRAFEWKYLWKYLNGERLLFEGHRSIVTCVAVSPDGQRAASSSVDGTVRVWNLARGEILALLGDPKTLVPVNAVAFSPDGKTLASAGAEKSIHLWDLSDLKIEYVEQTKPVKSLSGHTGAVLALAFGKDANTLASAGADKTVILWELGQGKQKHTLKEHAGSVQALAFSADGKTLASGGAEAQLILWDADTGKKRQAFKTTYQAIATLAFSADGKTLASGGVESSLGVELGMIHFWDAASGKETLPAIQHSAGVFSVAFQKGDKVIASGGTDHVVRLWDTATGKQQQHWLGHLGAVRSVAFAGDGSALVSGSVDRTVKVWNPGQSSGPDVIAAHADWVQSLAIDRKNALLASGSSKGEVKLWDAANGNLLLSLPAQKGAVTSLAFSSHADKTILAAGSRADNGAGEIKLWQLTKDAKQGWTPKDLSTLSHHGKGVNALAFNPATAHANYLLSGGADNTVMLWDADTGKDKFTYSGHTKEVRCVAFSPDGKAFASGGKDMQVCLYELDNKEHATMKDLHLASVESMAMMRFLVQGEELPGLVTGSADQTACLWILLKNEKGQMQPQKLRTFRSHVQPLTGVLYNEKLDEMIVSSSWDGSIKLYDRFSERFTLLGHAGAVRALVMASDQSFIASAGNDGTVQIWRAAKERTAGQ